MQARNATTLASALILTLVQTGCGEPRYPAVEVTLDEYPGVTFQMSAADATSASPVVTTVKGRELTAEDGAHRIRLQRRWVAMHAPEGSSLAAMGSAICGVERKGEFPGCDIVFVQAPGMKEETEYFFYDGNWPFANEFAK